MIYFFCGRFYNAILFHLHRISTFGKSCVFPRFQGDERFPMKLHLVSHFQNVAFSVSWTTVVVQQNLRDVKQNKTKNSLEFMCIHNYREPKQSHKFHLTCTFQEENSCRHSENMQARPLHNLLLFLRNSLDLPDARFLDDEKCHLFDMYKKFDFFLDSQHENLPHQRRESCAPRCSDHGPNGPLP